MMRLLHLRHLPAPVGIKVRTGCLGNRAPGFRYWRGERIWQRRFRLISLTTIIAVLTVGLHEPNGQLKLHTPKHYADLMQKYFDENDDADIDAIIVPVFKALVSTGILGRSVYLATFPEDATPEMKESVKDEEEKNV